MRRWAAIFLIYSALCASTQAEMEQAAYVWQRAWAPSLESAIVEQADLLDGLTVLCAEITPGSSSEPTWVPVLPNWEQLKITGLPITLAIRVGTYTGSFEADQVVTRCLLEAVEQALGAARSAGLEPAAVEVDFDCATRNLEGYATWLRLIRDQLDGPALSITTLPTWMGRPRAFTALIEPVDHFVLQVHSVQRADTFESDALLCDPQLAKRWVKQAAAFAKSYHVALPTYAYRLGYDASDELVEVAGENASALQRPDWRYRVLRADPDAMAGLVEQLQEERPDNCHGVIWYRLPIGQELYNWDPVTWRAVMSGAIGAVGDSAWQVHARVQPDGLVELELVQAAAVAVEPPRTVRVSWSEGTALAWDGQRHYAVRSFSDHALLWEWPDTMSPPLLMQGTRWTIGWLRIEAATELQISILNDDD